MIREHVDALLARLREDSALATIVVDGAVDPTAGVKLPPYVVVYVDSGLRSVERESSEQPTKADFRITTHSVGSDANQARFFAGKVLDKFLGWKPTVTGWDPRVVQHSRSFPVQSDTSIVPASQYLTDGFTMTSRKA